MLQISKLEITVKEVRGECEFGHEAGDSIDYNGRRLCGEICLEALGAMIPTLCAYYRNAQFPWDKNPDETSFACPDPENVVVFEIKRIGERNGQ